MLYNEKRNLSKTAAKWLLINLMGVMWNETALIKSCCSGETGRCVGSANCTACKNCKYCKHCNSGGSCGVCVGSSSYPQSIYRPTYPSFPQRSEGRENNSATPWNGSSESNKTSKETSIYNLPNDIFSEYYLRTLLISPASLNLRTGPGTNYPVLRILSKYEELVFLAMQGSWVKVRTKNSDLIGFVYYEYVYLKE